MHWELDSCCWVIVSTVKGFMRGLQWFRFCSVLAILVYFGYLHSENVSPDMFKQCLPNNCPASKEQRSALLFHPWNMESQPMVCWPFRPILEPSLGDLDILKTVGIIILNHHSYSIGPSTRKVATRLQDFESQITAQLSNLQTDTPGAHGTLFVLHWSQSQP